MFGLKTDKVHRDAIAVGNELTFVQVYNFAKTEESTRAQMDIIAKPEQVPEVHAVRSKKTYPSKFPITNKGQQGKRYPQNKQNRYTKPCDNCEEEHAGETCPGKDVKCFYCKRTGHYKKKCPKKRQGQRRRVHEMTEEEQLSEDLSTYTLREIGSITSTSSKSINDVSMTSSGATKRHIDKIFAKVKLNDSHNIKLKVDTGSDTCTLTSDDFKKSHLAVKIIPSNCVLKTTAGEE